MLPENNRHTRKVALAMDFQDTRTIMLGCESGTPVPGHENAQNEPMKIESRGREVIVISDLHIASGRRSDGVYSGTENFFVDDSFKRFLEIGLMKETKKDALLIINGDFVDFIRIVRIPSSDDEFAAWQNVLSRIGIDKSLVDLRASISKKEVEYGLKTHDFKSVWKLSASVAGHPGVFESLAKWISTGRSLIITRGNHDLEWYWPAVRNYLRLVFAEHIAELCSVPVEHALKDIVLPSLTFVEGSLLIDGDCYVEHGHCYDKFATVFGPVLLDNHLELNIPFGSFFNRYLINQVELYYPYVDNIRPQQSVLSLLVRERFPLALKMLFYHLPFGLRMIGKGYFRFMFGMPALFLLAVGGPTLIIGLQLLNIVLPLLNGGPSGGSSAGSPSSGFLLQQGIGLVRDLGSLVGSGILSYWLGRFVAYFRLSEPNTLVDEANNLFALHPEYRIITFGHTHNPEQRKANGRWYFNTGTWIPILEVSSADLREDKTYTFLRLECGTGGKLQPSPLLRWNDDAERIEPLLLVERSSG